MSQIFDKIKVASGKRSTFDLSHDQVTTSDFGYLVPICYRDMVPNDDFVVSPNIFTRLAPLAVPTYGRITCRVHHFFVPYRILYPHWDAFITQSSANLTVPPYFPASTLKQSLNLDPQFSDASTTLKRGTYGRLMANLGLNPSIILSDKFDSQERVSAFPFLAYYRIWMDYFADTNIFDHSQLEAAFRDSVASGGSMAIHGGYLLTRPVCYKKDYFTTAKTKPQDGVAASASSQINPELIPQSAQTTLKVGTDGSLSTQTANTSKNLSQFTIEALRAANSLQRYLERNNFVGTKLINRLLAHFGVAPTAERLDMAEFIDGTSFPIEIGDVTSHNSFADPGSDNYSTYGLGMQAGKAWGSNRNNPSSCRYHATEHGIFMSVLSILPDTSYYQGISRMWQKGVTGEPLDFFTPEFENLGYQELLNKEVYVPQNASSYSDYDPLGVFGWTPRYSEYKFAMDVLAGDFVGRTAAVETNTGSPMDSWHLFRRFVYNNDSPLALNENFVELKNRNTNYDRIFQLTDNTFDHFYFNIHMDVKATRPMSGFVEPSLSVNNEGDGNSVNLPYGGTRL